MSKIEDKVAEKIKERALLGLTKYGISMEDETLTTKEWLIHAQNEALDLAVYLQKLIEDGGVLYSVCCPACGLYGWVTAHKIEWAEKNENGL